MKRTALSVTLLVACLSGCGGPPQIGPDRDTFKAVDALYTAVSLRDARLVAQCATTLKDHQAQGKLPESAGATLEAIISETREGKWEASQSRLGDFMRGQRR